MSKFDFERFDASIVVVGSLNPAITTPDWLLNHQLISQSDRDSAMQSLQALVPQGVIAFECDWFSLNVVHQKFTAITKQGSTPRLRDLIVSIFGLLGETPVSAIGLNFHADCKLSEASDYYRFGDALAPKEIWHRWFPESEFAVGVLAQTMEISPGPRTSAFPVEKGKSIQQVTIQPSPRAVGVVSLAINNHIDLGAVATGRDVARIVSEQWERKEEESRNLVKHLVESAVGGVDK